MGKFSILHISDLHRENGEFNDHNLIYALKKDLESLKDSGAEWPSICVVSGDLVQGASTEISDPISEIQKQYEETGKLLDILVTEILNGKKTNIVIVPGNHDVCRAIASNAFQKIALPQSELDRERLFAEAQNPSHGKRFSPRKHSYFAIKKMEDYWERFGLFRDFYNKFYDGYKKYSIIPKEQFDIWEFMDLRLIIVTFNSSSYVDNYNFIPSIHPDVIVEVCQKLESPRYRDCIIVAVWHHNLRDSNTAQDSLGREFTKYLMLANICVCLHGHQHSTEIKMLDGVYGDNQRLHIIGVGSFCGSHRQLPYATPRGYNLVMLNTNNGRGTVYFRQMDCSSTYPTFGEYFPQQGRQSHRDFLITKLEPEKVERSRASQLANSIIGLLLSEKPYDALKLISQVGWDNKLRPFLVATLAQINDPELTIKHLDEPLSNNEAFLLAKSILEIGSKVKARAFLDTEFVRGHKDTISPLLKNIEGLAYGQ